MGSASLDDVEDTKSHRNWGEESVFWLPGGEAVSFPGVQPRSSAEHNWSESLRQRGHMSTLTVPLLKQQLFLTTHPPAKLISQPGLSLSPSLLELSHLQQIVKPFSWVQFP